MEQRKTTIYVQDENFILNDYNLTSNAFFGYQYLIVGIDKKIHAFHKKYNQKNNLETILPQKTGHKGIGTTLPRLKINSKSLRYV